ncbi:MAG TPA: tetratricopeptide repeat protein [Bryobacteraceae bacterium]|nr:tetratricopeptide repeat protein [Bryobacteraceae bacterium]
MADKRRRSRAQRGAAVKQSVPRHESSSASRWRIPSLNSRSVGNLVVILALACTWFLYHHALSGQFLYDDIPQIRDNPALLSWSSTLHYFRDAIPFSSGYLTNGGSFYRPLLWVSLAIGRRLWGLNPLPFHAVNITLHCVNGLLWLWLLRRLGVSRWWSIAAMILWLSLPINSEAVAWISGRYILLFTFFVLGSLVATDLFLSSRRTAFLVLLCFLELCAALSYEAGVLAAPLTLMWLYFRAQKFGKKAWGPVAAVALFVCVFALSIRPFVHAELPTGSAAPLSLGLTFLRYLQWMVLPIRMSIERSTDLPVNAITLAGCAAFVVLTVLVAVAIYCRRKLPLLSFAIAWLFVTLIPFCGLVPNYQGMAERYEYLASMGLAVAIVSLMAQSKGGARTVSLVAAVVWLGWGAWRVNARALDWKNEGTLARASLQATPNSAILWYNLALTEADAGDVSNAISHYRRAIAVNPRYQAAFVNLSNLLRRQGKYQEALDLMTRSVALNASDADSWTSLGNIYEEMGMLQYAANAYRKAVNLSPNNALAVVNLGAAFQLSGDLEAAQDQYERALELAPNEISTYCNLSMVLFQQHKSDEAIRLLKKGIAIDSKYPAAYFDLGVIYEGRGDKANAVAMYNKALALSPNYKDARLRLNRLQQ